MTFDRQAWPNFFSYKNHSSNALEAWRYCGIFQSSLTSIYMVYVKAKIISTMLIWCFFFSFWQLRQHYAAFICLMKDRGYMIGFGLIGPG